MTIDSCAIEIKRAYLHDMGGFFNLPDDEPIPLVEWVEFSHDNVRDYIDIFLKTHEFDSEKLCDRVIQLLSQDFISLNTGSGDGISPKRILQFIKDSGFYYLKRGEAAPLAEFSIGSSFGNISTCISRDFKKNFPRTVEFSRSKNYAANSENLRIHTAYIGDQLESFAWSAYGYLIKSMPVPDRALALHNAFLDLRPTEEA
ncbi:hypothetical protein J3E64_004092 [Sphingobium sp. OAS761]|uniref:hypothetical protein n=1 Tax=Sphingobium sp. OAS761 TaxID=2817901 RepID=UPI0020A1F26A|nr:hypothetical protein [Sphingobium sp. OAS761]MCP1472374.1 hypothetical protein [Sphingobium sp. OAS761]